MPPTGLRVRLVLATARAVGPPSVGRVAAQAGPVLMLADAPVQVPFTPRQCAGPRACLLVTAAATGSRTTEDALMPMRRSPARRRGIQLH